jgi:hypothetical protein
MFDITNEERYVKLAQELAQSQDLSAKSIESAILKIANENDYSIDQIRRLSEATNHALFTRMLEDDSNKFDKTSSFDIVNPDKIISSYYKEPTEKTASLSAFLKTAADVSGSLSDYYKAPKSFDAPIIKQAAVETPEYNMLEDVAPNGYAKKELLKLAQEKLEQNKFGAKLVMMETLDKLACLFSYVDGPDFNKFAQDSIAIYGDPAIPFVRLLREQCAVEERLVKTSSVINTRTKEHQLFKQVLDASKEYINYSNAITKISSTLGK